MKLSFDIFGERIATELIGSDELIAALERVIPSTKTEPSSKASVVVHKNAKSGHYELTGDGLHQSFTCADPINAICGITSGIIGRYAQLAKNELCFHSAAIIFNGRAFLIPATYQSGKSSFCLSWLQSGGDILTDDATILDPATHHVRAFGLPLCIRNSLLHDASREKRDFVDRNRICSGKNLTYIMHQHVHSMTSYPFGGWLFLSRQEGAEISVTAVNPSSVLQQIIWQNFARSMPPSSISKIAAELANNYPILFLNYSEADDVIPRLKEKLNSRIPNLATDAQPLMLKSEFGQADHISVLMTEAGGIVSDDRKGRVYSFNIAAMQFWYLMTSNTNPEDVRAILTELYPETSIELVLRDFEALKTKLMDLDLLQMQLVTNAGPQPSEIAIKPR